MKLRDIIIMGAMLLTALSADAQPAPMLTLNNGVPMPQFGIGTYGEPSNEIISRQNVS